MVGFWILTVLLTISLAVLSYIDIRTYRLPNQITFPLIIAGFLQSLVLQGVWVDSFIGGLFGYGFFVLIEVGFKRFTGRDGLGRGDAKLMAAAGTWLGYVAIPKVALLGSLFAIGFILLWQMIVRVKVTYIPFGPFIAVAFIGLWLFQVFEMQLA